MILGIDVGNTSIVYGRIDDPGNEEMNRVDTGINSVSEILRYYRHGKFEGAILSSVVPAVTEVLKTAIPGLKVISHKMNMNITIGIDHPEELGQDLIVGAVAAVENYELPLAVIDMGTASTIFIVDQNHIFRGGTIHPGMNIELKSLDKCTALLPGLSFEKPEKVLGTNTVDCIRSGILYGHAGMADGIITQIEKELGYPLNCIATGGLARYIIPLCSHQITLDEELILKGLRILYQMN